MDDLKFQSVVRSRLQSAIAWHESDISPERAKLTRFYRGDVSVELPQKKGRSGVVSRDVRDVVLDILPSIVRVFLGPKVVEFEPVGIEDEDWAKQATDYANYILRSDNKGFLLLHSVFKDALIRRTGITKTWWDERVEVKAKRFSGMDDEQFAAVMLEAEQSDSEITEHDAEQKPDGTMTHALTIQSRKKVSQVKIEAVPLNEFIISRDAKCMDDAPLVAHKCYRRVGDLAAEGHDFDELLELAGDENGDTFEEEEEAREFDSGPSDDDSADDPAMRMVLWCESYIRIDADGDGIIELRKVCTAGTAHKVMEQEVVDDHPFADFCPEPEPHTFYGLGLGDCLDDLQLINTQLLRLGLDGIAAVITPRLVVGKNGGVELKDLLDNQIGGIVRANDPSAILPLPTDKAAPQMALETYRAMKEVRQERTGQNQASMGLSPDALQSVSRIAANELVQKAQSRVEMICRIFAETGMRRLFKQILNLITRYQDKERVIRLRNRWIPMDPRNWNPDMDVTVNVGLGTGNVEEKTAFLTQFLNIQQQIMQSAGPANPWINESKIRNALEDLCEAAGKNAERYVMTTDEWQQAQQQKAMQPPQPPKPTPEEVLAQVEREKKQADMTLAKEKQRFDMQMELLADDRERDKLDADIVLQAAKLGIPPEATLAFIRQQRAATPTQVV